MQISGREVLLLLLNLYMQGWRRHLNLGGAGGSVVNRNPIFSWRAFAVAYVGISTQTGVFSDVALKKFLGNLQNFN